MEAGFLLGLEISTERSYPVGVSPCLFHMISSKIVASMVGCILEITGMMALRA